MKKIITLVFILSIFPLIVSAQTPNDPDFYDQWYLDKISAQEAWDITTGSKEVIVAVLDSGVDIDHPDLKENIWVNTGEIPDNGVDDDKNGFIDDVYGWDFVDDDNSVMPDTSEDASFEAVSHGSLVAGLIGAVGNNAEGVVGVNWNVRIMPVRMLDKEGAGSSYDASDAIDYAVANGADIINLSFSGLNSDTFLQTTVHDAYERGVLIVAALGNDDLDVNETPVYPACYKSETGDWVIGVAASNIFDKKALYSNYGSVCTDISAPGSDIYGVNYFDPTSGFNDAYLDGWSGTSMASPLVSGAAALIKSEYSQASPSDIKTILQLSVDPLSMNNPLRTEMGAGRLNIASAFSIAETYFESINEAQHGAEPEETAEVIRGNSFSTVYDISGDGRRAFINSTTYFTYYDSFDAVDGVDDDYLTNFDLTGLVLPKPGVVLVKIQSIPTVYALEENVDDMFSPFLREIESELIAVEMYGNNWADYVIDIEPTFFSHFSWGMPIYSPESVDLSIMKTRNELAQLAQ